MLVHLNVVPRFIIRWTPYSPEAQMVPVPDPMFKWICIMRCSLDVMVTQALTNDNVIPPL